MNNEKILYITFLIIFFVLIIVLIWWNVFLKLERINPKSCPVLKGDYAVNVNMSVKLKNNCGINANDICSFENISSLSSAIEKCNALFPNCDNFTYDQNTQIMNIVDISPEEDSTHTVYTRQTNFIV